MLDMETTDCRPGLVPQQSVYILLSSSHLQQPSIKFPFVKCMENQTKFRSFFLSSSFYYSQFFVAQGVSLLERHEHLKGTCRFVMLTDGEVCFLISFISFG